MNPVRKKDSMVRDIRQFNGTFASVVQLRFKLLEEFEDQLPPTTRFSVGYFIGRQSTKKWIVTQEDLEAMYKDLIKAKKTQVCLWCEGGCDESQGKRKRSTSPTGQSSKRAAKENDIDELVEELKEEHVDQYSDPQYRLWARMIINGIHSSRETPPQVPMITGITPTRQSKKPVEETIANTVTAVLKSMGTIQPLQQVQNVLTQSAAVPQSTLGMSPGKAVEIRGRCFSQLATLKQLYEDSVLNEEELKEQKSSILETLSKLKQ